MWLKSDFSFFENFGVCADFCWCFILQNLGSCAKWIQIKFILKSYEIQRKSNKTYSENLKKIKRNLRKSICQEIERKFENLEKSYELFEETIENLNIK